MNFLFNWEQSQQHQLYLPPNHNLDSSLPMCCTVSATYKHHLWFQIAPRKLDSSSCLTTYNLLFQVCGRAMYMYEICYLDPSSMKIRLVEAIHHLLHKIFAGGTVLETISLSHAALFSVQFAGPGIQNCLQVTINPLISSHPVLSSHYELPWTMQANLERWIDGIFYWSR